MLPRYGATTTDVFTLVGNQAKLLWLEEDVDFIDTENRQARERELEKAAAELAKPVQWATEPAFQPKRPSNHYPLAEFAPK